MTDIVGLLLPFFGLIFIGYGAARITKQPVEAMGWLNTFIIYAALPALFFKLVSKTPVEELARMDFVAASLACTYGIFLAVFLIGRFVRKNSLAETTIQSFAASYGNIGYMGPGLALAVLGTKASAPTALIFCCDSIFLFTIVPLLIELSDRDHPSLVHAFGVVLKQIVLNPLIMSACFGAAVAALHIELPVALDRTITFLQNAAAPTALFVLGVTVALRPFDRVPWEVPGVIAVKLLIHPLAAFGLMLAFGPFAQPWAATAVLMASLPPALNVFVIARQNDAWIESASVAVLLGTFASVVTLTSVMWAIQSGRLVFP